MSASERPIFVNDKTSSKTLQPIDNARVSAFHKSLPGYAPSSIYYLPDLAEEVGVKEIVVKYEGSRFGLPSFKILGASWGCFCAITTRLELSNDSTVEEVKAALKQQQQPPLKLFAATDGNHGRAVAFMARMLQISAVILVPACLDQHVKDAISSEGAIVEDVDGDYDRAVMQAFETSEMEPGGVLVQDTSWEGYEEIPQRIVEGYSTMLTELTEQLALFQSEKTVVISPVGVGSLAHAVVKICKSMSPSPKVVTVEPDTSACLYESLLAGKATSIRTSYTIMTGIDCGTVSRTAWNDLRDHVDISLTVSDIESHCSVMFLKQLEIHAGPCGAAGVAAVRHLAKNQLLDHEATVVLLCTESARQYDVPS